MNLTKHLPETDQGNVSWDDDRLDRIQLAQQLTSLLHSIQQPFVISLDSPYGTGKSFFLHRWKRDLVQHGYFCVTFDAWKSDFSDDPLFAFIASVKGQLL